MTTEQSQRWVDQYKNGDENTRVAMLQGLEMQFGDLNNKAYQQLLADGLPETAILSSYFQNPEMTKSFLSLDSEDKRKNLKQWGADNGAKLTKIRKDIRTSKTIKLFEDIVAENGGANSAATVDQMENIFHLLKASPTLLSIVHKKMLLEKKHQELLKIILTNLLSIFL